MGMILTDGAGQGFSAAVDGDNKLEVHSTMHSEEHFVSVKKGRAYFANSADTANTLTMATGNTYNILFLRNLSAAKFLIVEKIFASYDVAGTELILRKNMTVGAITNSNTHTPVNLNFSSGHNADVLSYSWDEVGTAGITGLTVGTIINVYLPIIGVTKLPINGSMVLGQNDSITVIGANATGGNVEIVVGIRFYMNDNTDV